MPKYARSPTPEVEEAGRLLRAYLRQEGLTPNAFSRRNHLVQSTVQRLLTGRTKHVTPAVRRILGHASIDPDSGIIDPGQARHNLRLQRALQRAWNGSPETAELLAQLIEAIGVVLKTRDAKIKPDQR